jgi:hypothetical protein
MGLKQFLWRQKKGLVIAIVGLVIVFNVFVWLFPSLLPAWLQQRQSGEQIQEQVYDSENAIQNYEWFKSQRQDIIAQRKQINTTNESLTRFYKRYGTNGSEWSYQAQQRHSDLIDRLDGQQNMHDQMVAEYNSRANQAHRAIFQCGLPYEMEKKFWLEDGRPNDQYDENAPSSPKQASQCTELPTTNGN